MEREKKPELNNHDRVVAVTSGALIATGIITEQGSLVAAGLTLGTIGAGVAKGGMLLDKFERQQKEDR